MEVLSLDISGSITWNRRWSWHGKHWTCDRLKEKGNKGKVVLKLSKRKDADEIKLNKEKLKKSNLKNIGFSSGTKAFTNESLYGYYKVYFGRNAKNYIWKKRLHRSALQMEQ